MIRLSKFKLEWLLPCLFAGLGLLLLLWNPLPLQTLQNNLFDQYQRWSPRAYQPVPVRIIDIDEASLARYGQWPWPRTRLAELVERLQQANVAAVGFDVVFAETDRTSPKTVAEKWPLSDVVRKAVDELPDHDTIFAASMAHAPVVLGSALTRQNPSSTSPNQAPPVVSAARYVQLGEVSPNGLHSFSSAVLPLPLFQQKAAGVGAVTFVPDADGVVRRVPLVLSLAGKFSPSLSSEVLRVGLGAKNVILRAAEAEKTGLSGIQIGEFFVPTTGQGEMWIHYTPTEAQRSIPVWQVLENKVDPRLLDGHLVVLGTSAQGLMDLRFNPLGQVMAGVEAHTQALEQILSGHFLQRPSWAFFPEYGLVLGLTLLVGFLSLRLSALWAAVSTLGLCASVLAAGWWVFQTQLLLIDTLTPVLVALGAFVSSSLVHHFVSERQQRWIKEAFSRYVSPNRVQYLVDHPDSMALGGQRQVCSFVFTDLAGFTSLMESLDPSEAVTLLNAYLDQMVSIAFQHEGTLDRIVGDAVAIVFSAPVVQPDHADRAIACALEMSAFATEYAKNLQASGVAFGLTRIGVHTGEVIVGNFGGSNLFDYRALGDVVNTASRLEGANKYLGTSVCVSEATLKACVRPLAARMFPVARLVLKGKTQALAVFTPLFESASSLPFADYVAAYEQLGQSETDVERLALSAQKFTTLHQKYPDNPLLGLHCKRLQAGEQGDVIRLEGK